MLPTPQAQGGDQDQTVQPIGAGDPRLAQASAQVLVLCVAEQFFDLPRPLRVKQQLWRINPIAR